MRSRLVLLAGNARGGRLRAERSCGALGVGRGLPDSQLCLQPCAGARGRRPSPAPLLELAPRPELPPADAAPGGLRLVRSCTPDKERAVRVRAPGSSSRTALLRPRSLCQPLAYYCLTQPCNSFVARECTECSGHLAAGSLRLVTSWPRHGRRLDTTG